MNGTTRTRTTNGATKITRKRGRTRLTTTTTTTRAAAAQTTLVLSSSDGNKPAPSQSAGQNEGPKGESWQLDSAIEWVFANKTLS